MTDLISNIERKLDSREEISNEDFQKLRIIQERIDDIADRVEGYHSGIDEGILEAISPLDNGLAIVVGHTKRRQGAYATYPINQNEYE